MYIDINTLFTFEVSKSDDQSILAAIVQRDQQGLKLLAANDGKIFPKYENFLCVSVGTRCNL
jgi:hypothetical protein